MFMSSDRTSRIDAMSIYTPEGLPALVLALQPGHLLGDLLHHAGETVSDEEAARAFVMLRDALLLAQRFSNPRVAVVNIRFCLRDHGLSVMDPAGRAAVDGLADAMRAYIAAPDDGTDARLRAAWAAVPGAPAGAWASGHTHS